MEKEKEVGGIDEAKEDKIIEDAFQHLLDTYLASPHRKKVDIITKAFHFAKQAHKGVRRLSGEPYILHPISVAQIACEEVGLGSTSICSDFYTMLWKIPTIRLRILKIFSAQKSQ